MQLIDAIFLIEQHDEGAVICAREPFYRGSDAVIERFTADLGIPESVKAAGYRYFLGRDEVIELLGHMSNKRAFRETKAEYVCHYATFDAYPAWFSDISDLS